MPNVRQSPRSAPRYPIGSVAFYGPDGTRATKLVASVIRRPGNDHPSAMRTWKSDGLDLRTDRLIAVEVEEFLRQHRVKDTIAADRMLGCPHEEGVDYPMGRACPQCPFWATIDRFTHEPIEPPTPTMSPEEILAQLRTAPFGTPREALESADGHREALLGPLTAALERGLADPEGATEEDADLFGYALYLCATWRETRAYPLVIRWLSLPGEGAFDIAGDIVTQDGARILAAVCDGDLQPIQSLINNRDADEWCRGGGVHALALLAAWAEVPREPIVSYFSWLAREGLEREPVEVWNALANACADIEAIDVFPDLRRAYHEGLADPMSMQPSELDDVERSPRGALLDETRSRYPPIDDVVDAMTIWTAISTREPDPPPDPYRAPAKVGRNEPCPCGSGRKYKKCCGA